MTDQGKVRLVFVAVALTAATGCGGSGGSAPPAVVAGSSAPTAEVTTATPAAALPPSLQSAVYGYRFPNGSRYGPGQFLVSLLDGSHASLRLARGSIVADDAMTLAIQGHKMTFSHGSSGICLASTVGTYRWRLVGHAIVMTLIKDNCHDRATFMTWKPLVKE